MLGIRLVRRAAAFAALALVSLYFWSASPATAGEVMTDRCSAEVSIPIQYDGHPDAAGTVILKRDAAGTTPWSPPIKVETDSDGHVRWWCHSTTGNWADAGTWRVSFNSDGVVGCLVAIGSTIASDGGASGSLAACLKLVKLGSSAFKDWTPERSRCNDHSNVIRARLGPDRLLQTECLPAQKPAGQS